MLHHSLSVNPWKNDPFCEYLVMHAMFCHYCNQYTIFRTIKLLILMKTYPVVTIATKVQETKQNKQTEKSFFVGKRRKCPHWKILEALKFYVKESIVIITEVLCL